MNILRKAWRRMVRIVMMPDPVMGHDRVLAVRDTPAIKATPEVQGEHTR